MRAPYVNCVPSNASEFPLTPLVAMTGQVATGTDWTTAQINGISAFTLFLN